MIDLVSPVYDRIKVEIWPARSNRASEAGHPCRRYLVALRTASDMKEPPSKEQVRTMNEGKLHEEAVLSDLRAAKFNIVETQRPFEWKKYQISGKIDARVEDNEDGKRIFPPVDVKSASSNSFRAIERLDALGFLKSKYPWVRKYPAQIILYALMAGEPYGILLFKNKESAALSQKNFPLDSEALEYAEEILKKLDEVNAAIAAGRLPDVVVCAECPKCPFKRTLCFPPVDYGDGVNFVADPGLAIKLDRWDALRRELEDVADVRAEFEALDEELKAELGGKNIVVGDWQVTSTSYERTLYDVPKEIKSTYAKTKTYYKTTWEKI